MQIILDEQYNVRLSSLTLGYVGETNARTITFTGLEVTGAELYKMRLSYPYQIEYEVDITGGEYVVDGSLLRTPCDVQAQILACRAVGDIYELVKKSNIFKLEIKPSLTDEPAPVPTYEQSVEALEKVLAADVAVQECIDSAETAKRSAESAKRSEQSAGENAASTSADRTTVETAKAAVDSTAAQVSADRAAVETARDGAQAAKQSTETSKADAEKAAERAVQSAAEAKASEDNAEQSEQAVLTAKTEIDSTAKEISDRAAEVTQNAETVAADRTAVEVARDTAVEKSQEIADSAEQITQNKEDISQLSESITELKSNFTTGKNIFATSKLKVGYKFDDAKIANITTDARFAYSIYPLGVGKTILATVERDGQRTKNNAVRHLRVNNKNEEKIYFNGDMDYSSSTYTNNTDDTVYVWFLWYYNYQNYSDGSFMVEIFDDVKDATVLGYDSPKILISEIDFVKDDIADYFKAEINDTVKKVINLGVSPCLSMPIISDNHLSNSDKGIQRTNDTIKNIKAVCEAVYTDGIVHLGDLIDTSLNPLGSTYVYSLMNQYIQNLYMSHPENRLFLANGNHDGGNAYDFSRYEWYSIAGRQNANKVKRYYSTPYYYFDNKFIKTRCIFLATPDQIDGSSPIFGYTNRMLEWLATDALQVDDGWGVIMFAHIVPYHTWYIGSMQNNTSFAELCNAFHAHTSYSDGHVTCDFSDKTNTKLVAYIAGHCHGDSVLMPNETVTGKDENGVTVQTTNRLPCPCITIGCNALSTTVMSNYNAAAPLRYDKDVSQDLWDFMIYRPDINKINLIRFGAGNDREISVN